jgi:Rod binding domain-containing protein
MTVASTANLGLPLAAPSRGGSDPKKIHESAQQFESLLIAQVLKSGRESGGGWLGTGDDEAGSTCVEMAEQQVAQTLAASGGLGLSRLIEQGLTRDAQNAKDPAPTPAPTPSGSAG